MAQRLKEVREREGFTLRTVARRMGEMVETVRSQEDSAADLRISDLRRWSAALKVPLAELLDDETSSDVMRHRGELLNNGGHGGRAIAGDYAGAGKVPAVVQEGPAAVARRAGSGG